MANTLNLDYKQDNEYLPQNLRLFIGQGDKIRVQAFDIFFSLFDDANKYALFNNWYAAQFASGWTILNKNNVRSGVAPRLLKIKTQKTVGKVYYQAADKGEKQVDNKLPKEYLSKKLYTAFDKANRTGRCAIVLYNKADEKPYIATYDAFRHELVFNDSEEIIDAKLYIVKLENAKGSAYAFSNYFIIEHRYYKDNEPYQEINVVYQEYASEKRYDAKVSIMLKTDEIPDFIKETYKDIKFNKPIKLEAYIDLGVYHIDQSATNSKFPDLNIPEAMFVDAMDTIVMAEQGLTDKEVEKEIGRGQVLIPEFGKGYSIPMMGATPNSQMAISLDSFMPSLTKNPVIQKYPTRSMEDSKPQNVQFDIRADQWAISVNDDVARLCAIVGISILDYDPRLLQTGQRTDDEINAMTDITASTVMDARALNEVEVNRMLACLSAMYGLANPLKIRWSMASILNPSKNATKVIAQFNAGLMSKKQALRELYPDLMEQEIEQIYNEIKEETSYNPEREIINDYNNF